MAVRIWREGKQLGLSASRIYRAVGMAFGLSPGGTSISLAYRCVSCIKYLNQYTRTMSSALIVVVIGFAIVAIRVFTETNRKDD